MVLSSHSRNWLAQHLAADLQSLDPEQQQIRLTQLADLGLPGIDPLVAALVDENIQVARTAYELLQKSQQQWLTQDRAVQQRHHQKLVGALQKIAIQLPDDRTGWGTLLMQQTIQITANQRDDASRKLRRDATHAIEVLSLSDRAGPSVLSDQPIDANEPRRLIVRSKPLSLTAEEPRHGEPDPTTPLPGESEELRQMSVETQNRASSVVARSTGAVPTQEASVYSSGSAIKLRPAETDRPLDLRDISAGRETAIAAKPIHSVAHVVDSPVQTLDDSSVMQWLGSPHTSMREKAETELRLRGYDGTEIAIATQIAAGDTPARLALVDAISRSSQLDPRPWLFLLLNDQNRQVKLRTISVLATMQDAYVDQRLRKQLSEEQDAEVIARIRRVLELR